MTKSKNAPVRSTVKAIILHENKVLLNRCRDPWNGDYDSLPGGGQHQYETLREAIRRECREETGYEVEPMRFCALLEEICEDPFIRETYPQYAHKMLHIFVCRLASSERAAPTEKDEWQVGEAWVAPEDVAKRNLLPAAVRERFLELITNEQAVFLGSSRIAHNHG